MSNEIIIYRHNNDGIVDNIYLFSKSDENESIINDLNSKYDDVKLVGGIRRKRKDNIFKKVSSRTANFIRRIILKDDCTDTGCSLKVFDRNTFLSLPYFNGIHRFIPALYKYSNSRNIFIDVDHRLRKSGESKYGFNNRFYKGIIDIFRVRKIIKKIRNK